jgi:hypothetical protein
MSPFLTSAISSQSCYQFLFLLSVLGSCRQCSPEERRDRDDEWAESWRVGSSGECSSAFAQHRARLSGRTSKIVKKSRANTTGPCKDAESVCILTLLLLVGLIAGPLSARQIIAMYSDDFKTQCELFISPCFIHWLRAIVNPDHFGKRNSIS